MRIPDPLTNIYHGVAPTRLPFSPGAAPGIIPNATFTVTNVGNGTAVAAPDVRVPEARDIQLNASARNEPVAILLGRNRVGAKLGRPLNASGGSLLFPLLWGDGEYGIDAVESITMGNKPLPANATVVHYDGTQTSPDSHLVTAMAGVGVTWTSAMTGVAWTKVILPPLDPAGNLIDIGDFHAVIRGWKAHDPRSASVFATPSTWIYTTNTALLIARILTRYLLPSPDTAFWTSVTAAADRCDQIVSGTTKRFTLNYVVLQNERVEDLVAKLSRSAGLRVVPEGASFRFIIDQPGTSVGAINKSKWLDGSFSHAGKDVTERHNVVYVSYTEPNASGTEWVTRIAPRGADVPTVPASDVYRAVTLPGAWINSYQEALRYAQYEYGVSYLQDMTCAWTETADAAQYTVGDIRSLTEGPFTNKLIRITKHALANFDALWRTEAEEYQPATYSDAFVTDPTYPDTTLPSASTPPNISSLTLTESSVQTGNVFTTHLQLVWPTVSWPFPFDFRVVIYDESALIQDSVTTSAGFTSQPVAIGHNYRAFVYVRSSIAQSSGIYRSLTVSGSAAAAPGEMLWATFPIEPNATYLDKSFQRGLGDPQLHRYVSASGVAYPSGVVYKGASFFTPDMASTGAIDHQILLTATGGPSPPVGGSWTPPAINAGLAWKSSVITLFSGGHRPCRVVASLARTNIAYNDLQTGIVYGPWELGVQQASRTAYGGGIAADLSDIEVTIAAVNTYGAALVDTPGTLNVYTPTITEDQSVTSSAAGAVVVTCANNFAKIKGLPKVTPQTTAARYPTIENVTYGATCTFELRIFNDAGALTATPCSITIEGTV